MPKEKRSLKVARREASVASRKFTTIMYVNKKADDHYTVDTKPGTEPESRWKNGNEISL